MTHGQLVAADAGQQGDDLVVGRRSGAGQAGAEAALRLDELLAHPRPQFSGRHPPERDQQHVLQRRALGDVAGGEGGDRERLARPGAGLEQRHARRQRAAHVERRRGAHSPLRCSAASSPSHRRRA